MLTPDQICANLRRWGRAIGHVAFGQLLGEGPALRKARRAILHRIEEATNNYSDEAERLKDIAEGLMLDDVRRFVTFEVERRKSIEDKAKANLVAITIGFTVLFASLSFVGKKELDVAAGGPWAVSSFVFLIIGVSYLIYGGLKAIDALQIAQIYSPSPADESGVCETVRKIKLLWSLQQNERTSLLRTNAISVSYRSIRNGVISLAALVLIIAARRLGWWLGNLNTSLKSRLVTSVSAGIKRALPQFWWRKLGRSTSHGRGLIRVKYFSIRGQLLFPTCRML